MRPADLAGSEMESAATMSRAQGGIAIESRNALLTRAVVFIEESGSVRGDGESRAGAAHYPRAGSQFLVAR